MTKVQQKNLIDTKECPRGECLIPFCPLVPLVPLHRDAVETIFDVQASQMATIRNYICGNWK